MGGVERACGVRWDVLRVPRCLAAAFGGGGGMGGSGVGTTTHRQRESKPSPLTHFYPSSLRPSFLAAAPLRVDEPREAVELLFCLAGKKRVCKKPNRQIIGSFSDHHIAPSASTQV